MSAIDTERLAAEHREGLMQCYTVAKLVRALPTADLLALMNYAESFAHLVDPTLYREKARAMEEDKTVVAILSRAKIELDGLPWPEGA